MKEGERLVWAAAFAAAMDHVGPDGEPEEQQRLIGTAAAKAWFAVHALRRLTEIPQRSPAIDMLKDMAGVTN